MPTDDRWFVQRQHPEKAGMIQVIGPKTKADAEALCEQWQRSAPKLSPYIWQHPEDVQKSMATMPTKTEPTRLDEIVEEFVGWWGLNREGAVNRTYDYIDKLVKRLRPALEDYDTLMQALAESEKARQQAEAERDRETARVDIVIAEFDAEWPHGHKVSDVIQNNLTWQIHKCRESFEQRVEAEKAACLQAEQERDDLSWRLKIQASDCVKAIEATKDAQSTLAERTHERDEARAVLSALAEVANLTRTPPLSGDAVAGHTRAILARFFKTHELAALKASGSPAKEAAYNEHLSALLRGGDGHLDIDCGAEFNPGFEKCQHPDCTLVRDASAHLKETTDHEVQERNRESDRPRDSSRGASIGNRDGVAASRTEDAGNCSGGAGTGPARAATAENQTQAVGDATAALEKPTLSEHRSPDGVGPRVSPSTSKPDPAVSVAAIRPVVEKLRVWMTNDDDDAIALVSQTLDELDRLCQHAEASGEPKAEVR